MRIARLNQQVQSPYCVGGSQINSKLSAEGLQDALLALYEECSSEKLRKEPDVAAFLDKCKLSFLLLLLSLINIMHTTQDKIFQTILS